MLNKNSKQTLKKEWFSTIKITLKGALRAPFVLNFC